MHRACAAVAACLVSAVLAAPALGAEATTIGERYADGLDSRLAAQRLADAARAVGYTSTGHVSGRLAADAWEDGLRSAVFGAFGHANAGLAHIDEGVGGGKDQYLIAGFLGDAGGDNMAFWSDYLPFADVDWMKLAVFAGCDTALSSDVFGSWLERARELGVDSVIGFRDLVFYPASCTSCDYSGNYVWTRFSTYARVGDPIRVALSKAVHDLTALEGSPDGWNTYSIGGSVADPGGVRLTPASDGAALTSKPFGIDPFDPLALAVTQRRALEVGGRSVRDHLTAEGVAYRLDDAGELTWLQAPASTRGVVALSAEAAREAAVRFLRAHVAAFDPAELALTADEPATHASGERLRRLTWRRSIDGIPGPAAITVEVDQRTGAVTYLSVARAAGSADGVAADREDAIAAARRAVEAHSRVTSAELDVWDRARWAVTFAGDGGDLARVTIDAATGELLSVRRT